MGPVAHGGHCVARHDERVVFVRHALPGERVVVAVTQGSDGDSFWRGDAVEVLDPAADRVPAPCPYAGPGLCGGCDFQHVSAEGQRALKSAVVREQLTRLAGLDVDVVVEGVPPSLRWRTRMRYVDLPGDARGLHVHRSDEVVEVEDCLIDAGLPDREVETVTTAYGTRTFQVHPDGFWQSHLEAPRVLVETVLDLVELRPGERVLDLYAGVGLFAAFLADAVGPSGQVVAVEASARACYDARANLGSVAAVGQGAVDHVLATSYDDPFDVVVLDPPREGAKRRVVEQVVARRPRAVVYVACDQAALARDLSTFAELGYRLAQLRAFDLFPMTHHVECVALLTKVGSDLP